VGASVPPEDLERVARVIVGKALAGDLRAAELLFKHFLPAREKEASPGEDIALVIQREYAAWMSGAPR